jgi:GntR family transcriptional regulator
MTAKICYGHLVRRAGKNEKCWPSIREIARSTGLKDRQAMRAVKELANAQLIRPQGRRADSGRQTSNAYEFIWGPILQGESDTSDTLPPAKSDAATMTDLTPTGMSETAPLEVIKINHHQGRNKLGSKIRPETTGQVHSAPGFDRFSPHMADDAEPTNTEYASGKDELKALYFAIAGEHFRVVDLDSIESILFNAGVSWEIFVADLRRHSWDRITNPIGFLKDRAKKSRTLSTRSSAPVTAAEAAERAYKCQSCGSAIRGIGAVAGSDGKPVPCECASPDWIARQRARGVFGRGTPE